MVNVTPRAAKVTNTNIVFASIGCLQIYIGRGKINKYVHRVGLKVKDLETVNPKDRHLLCVDKEQSQEDDIILHVIGQVPQPGATYEQTLSYILSIDQVQEDGISAALEVRYIGSDVEDR